MAALTERIPRCIFRAASGTQTITTRARLSRCNQTFARRYFPAGDAIGQSIKLPELAQVARPPYLLTSPSASNPILIVGMVRDKRDDGLSKPIEPEIFVPIHSSPPCTRRSWSSQPMTPADLAQADLGAIGKKWS